MTKPYSQSKALWAITRASFKAIFNQPIAIFFSLLFPIIFILIFGAFGSGGPSTSRIAIEPGSDTSSQLFMAIKNNPLIKISRYADTLSMNKELNKGRLAAVLGVRILIDSATGKERYVLETRYTSASENLYRMLWQTLQYIKLDFELKVQGAREELVTVAAPQRTEVRKYRQIDFVLPGQIGFSILFSTLFGIAFTFYALREQLVLKRFYASPVNRIHILLGIGMSRLFFQLLNVVVLVLFGHFFMKFTLVNGFLTFLEMLVMSIIMLFLLMGVGLIFSSIVKTDASIPLWINLFGFPQMLLSGTFFPIEVFPKWLQQICNILPLTQFNNAVRKISFEGVSILDCWKEIGILGIWMVVTYVILVRVIKWQ
jgi:ABC-2 type transport system permease protein